jgi:hypothetical protein
VLQRPRGGEGFAWRRGARWREEVPAAYGERSRLAFFAERDLWNSAKISNPDNVAADSLSEMHVHWSFLSYVTLAGLPSIKSSQSCLQLHGPLRVLLVC